MPSPITKETLKHLAELARIELTPREEEKLLYDLQKIFDHFEELKTLGTADVEPLVSVTGAKNVFRDDDERKSTNRGAGTNAFPEKENGFLKIPPVFEK